MHVGYYIPKFHTETELDEQIFNLSRLSCSSTLIFPLMSRHRPNLYIALFLHMFSLFFKILISCLKYLSNSYLRISLGASPSPALLV